MSAATIALTHTRWPDAVGSAFASFTDTTGSPRSTSLQSSRNEAIDFLRHSRCASSGTPVAGDNAVGHEIPTARTRARCARSRHNGMSRLSALCRAAGLIGINASGPCGLTTDPRPPAAERVPSPSERQTANRCSQRCTSTPTRLVARRPRMLSSRPLDAAPAAAAGRLRRSSTQPLTLTATKSFGYVLGAHQGPSSVLKTSMHVAVFRTTSQACVLAGTQCVLRAWRDCDRGQPVCGQPIRAASG
jgi:hypothetical protein